MSSKRRILPSVVLAFCLFPCLAAGQGSIGRWDSLWAAPGFRGPMVDSFVRTGDQAFFSVSAFYLRELWRSDGTPQGTFQLDVMGQLNTTADQELRFWSVQGSRVFFTRPGYPEGKDPNRELWRSDGTVEGTVPLVAGLSFAIDASAGNGATSLAVLEAGLVFFSAGEQGDYELWATDGTAEGTRLVKDVNPSGPSKPSFMATLGGELFFLADTPQGRELWRSDGTPEGTERAESLTDLASGRFTLARAGNALFLLAETAWGVELWSSDGTEGGAFLALSLRSAQLLGYAAAGRRLFLAVADAGENELWVAEGDFTEPYRVLEATPPSGMTLWAAGDRAVFTLAEPDGQEPWVSDGTAAGTHRAGDLCPGECGGLLWGGEVNGWLVLLAGNQIWLSDGSEDSAFPLTRSFPGYAYGSLLPLSNRVLIPSLDSFFKGYLSSLEVAAPPPPAGEWLVSPRVPGFRFKVRIGQTVGRQERACLARTLCVGGVLPGRSEVFLRVSGPKPDGSFWPAAVKLTPAPVEVWVHQISTGYVRHHRLAGSDPASPILPGVLDRGFFPAPPGGPLMDEAAAPHPPSGPWVTDKSIKGFRVKARVASGGGSRTLRMEPCALGIVCLGAVKGQPDLLVRVTGKQQNGYQWPMLARFTPDRVEVWIEQTKTGTVRYYRLEAVPAGSTALDGYVDRQGFKKSAIHVSVTGVVVYWMLYPMTWQASRTPRLPPQGSRGSSRPSLRCAGRRS